MAFCAMLPEGWMSGTVSGEGMLVLTNRTRDVQSHKLPDGTIVMLTEKSSLAYGKLDYGHDKRVVILNGEAYFDVEHVPKCPFVVRSGDVSTTVMGTAFNVDYEKEITRVTITVFRGRVSVNQAGCEHGEVEAGQKLTVQMNGGSRILESIDNNRLKDLYRNSYVMDGTMTLSEAAALLSERYRVNIVVSNDALGRSLIEAKFAKDASLDEILDAVSRAMGNLEYKRRGDTIMLYDIERDDKK